MMLKLIDDMLLIYYQCYMKTPSKIVLNMGLERNFEQCLVNEDRHAYVNHCKYKGISLEFNINEDFIRLEK